MRKYILIIITLLLIGCNTNKQILLVQGKGENIRIDFYNYGSSQHCNIALRKKIKLKNSYIQYAKVKINYFREGEQIDESDAHPMDYGKDGKLYVIGSNWDDVYQVKIYPFDEREIIYEVNTYIESFKFEGIYKNLAEYVPLGKHPIRRGELTGVVFEDKNVLIYEEPFSEFKRKNPELLEFLTKGDSIELEVLSPVKQKYKFKAEW